MSTALATPAPAWRRWLSAVSGWFGRAPPADTGASMATDVVTERPGMGADHASGHNSRPGYDVEKSMSAMAAFPWVYAAVLRASGDIAGLPLRVVQGRGSKARILDDHPLYELLEQTSLRVTGRQFREQQVVDHILTGNHLAVQDLNGRGLPVALTRMHPRRVTIDPDPKEGWGDYIFEGLSRRVLIPARLVTHVRGPSWNDDPRGLWGTGAIECLNDDLTTDRRAAKSAATLAKRGRPDIIVSPADGAHAKNWDPEFRRQLKEALDALLEEGGTVVIGGGAKVDMPSWSPRDIEFPALRQLVREAVLAVTGVPPHMVGLPTANYALAEQQALAYWERNVARCKAIEDACWRPVARRYGPDLYVVHDFSSVDVLQTGRTARQQRAQTWWFMGADPAKAAAYEGFGDAPFASTVPSEPGVAAPTKEAAAPPPAGLSPADLESLLKIVAAVAAGTLTADAATTLIGVALPSIALDDAAGIVSGVATVTPSDPTSSEGKALLRLWLVGTLRRIDDARHAASPMGGDWIARAFAAETTPAAVEVVRAAEPERRTAFVVPQTEEARADYWRTWIAEIHGPAEKRVMAAAQRFLRGQGERLAEALRKSDRDASAPVTRNVADDLLTEIFDREAEDAAMRDALRDGILGALRGGYRAGGDQAGVDLTFDPVRIDTGVDAVLGSLVKANETTQEAVRQILRTGLNQGDSTADIATALMRAEAFSPNRALTIARTETTHSVNAGALLAYRDAEAEGVELEKAWLSSRDAAVREEHTELDNQTVPVDGQFEIHGDHADGPGGFAAARLNVNCRCTVVPKVKEPR